MAGLFRLCGRFSCVRGRNVPEWGKRREISVFTAVLGQYYCKPAEWGRVEGWLPMRTSEPVSWAGVYRCLMGC